MDPAPQSFQNDMKALNRKSLRKLRWLIFMHKVNETLPEIGPITSIITVGEMALWVALPTELQSSWSMFLSVWAAAMLVCVGIISVPRRYESYRAHWLSGD